MPQGVAGSESRRAVLQLSRPRGVGLGTGPAPRVEIQVAARVPEKVRPDDAEHVLTKRLPPAIRSAPLRPAPAAARPTALLSPGSFRPCVRPPCDLPHDSPVFAGDYLPSLGPEFSSPRRSARPRPS